MKRMTGVEVEKRIRRGVHKLVDALNDVTMTDSKAAQVSLILNELLDVAATLANRGAGRGK